MLNTHPQEELISAMADGKLNVAQTHLVAAHLRQCSECRDALAGFEKTKSLFRSLEKPAQPPDQFWDDTFRKMRTEGSPKRSPVVASPRRLRAVLAAVACVTAALVVPVSLHYAGITPQPASIGSPPSVEDSLDAADVSNFVSVHTQSVANQPLSDPDRQQMIAAEASMPGDNQTVDSAGSADVSL